MIEPARRRLVLEGIWIIAGQLFSALGTFLGLRLLTDVVAPQIFGEVVLFSGIVLLANGMAASPLMQAVLRYYPEAVARNTMKAFREIVNRYLTALTILTILACVLGLAVYSHFVPTTLWVWGSIILLLVLDVFRQRELTFLSAARHQGTAALWVTADVWARPAFALGMIALLGPTTGAVLIGYVAASFSLILVFKPWLIGHDNLQEQLGQDKEKLAQSLLRYSLPLMPLGAIGWVSGQADRYIIGLLVGVQEAGLYAATYGIVSRPFLMATGATESWLRPLYYEAVVTRDPVREKRIFMAWGIALAGVSALTIAVFTLWHKEMAALLLAPSYRSASALMPWIAVGYGLLSIAQVYERVCYAHNDTKGVFVTECFGGIAALVVTVVAVAHFGTSGAAYAVPLYFGLQLIVAMSCSRRLERLGASQNEHKPHMDKGEPLKQLCGLTADNQRLA